ncbi:MAG: hypothetical protein JNM84_02825 [Planctomycetes bacterium]|nr:hypothetical protein [Planctomycetota bacterium]
MSTKISRRRVPAMTSEEAEGLRIICAEFYGVDLAKVARESGEALALVCAFCASIMLDESRSVREQLKAAGLLLKTVPREYRGSRA